MIEIPINSASLESLSKLKASKPLFGRKDIGTLVVAYGRALIAHDVACESEGLNAIASWKKLLLARAQLDYECRRVVNEVYAHAFIGKAAVEKTNPIIPEVNPMETEEE